MSDETKELEPLDDNALFRILLRKLESSTSIIDIGTKQPVRVNENGELLVAIPIIEKITDKWTISIPRVIPEIENTYFWYYKNNDEKTVTITDIKFHATIEGVYSTNIYIHRVSGVPEFKNEITNKFVKLTNIDIPPEAEIKTATRINDLEDLGIIDKLNLPTKFKIEHLQTNIEVATGEAIGLKWEEPTGALSGTIFISKER